MSVSMYASQVDRLTRELGPLRAKLANEHKRLADATAKAIKASQAFSKARTPSQLSSRGREVERHQKAAASHEKKAADLEKTIARKLASLTSAQGYLERARREQLKKDDREAARRRRAEIAHISAIERGRPVVAPGLVERALRSESAVSSFTDTYDVCLSFAGEQRDYVELIAAGLKQAGLAVFYDQDEDIIPKLWGRDLGEYLDYIYRRGSRYCLMFISADYAEKAWTTHERRSALARVVEDGSEYLLPARFDDTELPGLRPTTGYVDLKKIEPATLVDFVLKKLDVAA